ncbi:MAG: GGDEF domain-containing protein [Pseudomonadota bacterium]
MKWRKLTLKELPPILLAFSGIAGVGPMAVYRAIEGNFLIAAIDLAAVIGFAAIAWAVYVKRAVRAGSVCMALVAVGTATATVSIRGGSQIIWMYPATVALFYLLKPKEAALASVVAIGLVLPTIFEGRDLGEIAILLASLGVTISLSVAFAAMTAAQQRQLEQITLQDPLTGLGNRRAMAAALDAAIQAARQTKEMFALIMWDIDHFKEINDNHGHASGDAVLTQVTQTVRRGLSETDACYRVGGEEFVVISRNTTLDNAKGFGDQLRKKIAETLVDFDESDMTLTVTASFGMTEYIAGDTADEILRRADEALYEAKRSGRNRLHMAERTVSLSGTATYATLTDVS